MEKIEKFPTETLDKTLTPEEAREQLLSLRDGELQDIVNRISWLHERGKRAPFIEDVIDGAFRRLSRVEKYLDKDSATDREAVIELRGQITALKRVNKAFPPERSQQ